MAVYHKEIRLKTVSNRPSYHDITTDIVDALRESKIQDGICVVSSPHTTCSVILRSICMIKIIMEMSIYKLI